MHSGVFFFLPTSVEKSASRRKKNNNKLGLEVPLLPSRIRQSVLPRRTADHGNIASFRAGERADRTSRLHPRRRKRRPGASFPWSPSTADRLHLPPPPTSSREVMEVRHRGTCANCCYDNEPRSTTLACIYESSCRAHKVAVELQQLPEYLLRDSSATFEW